MGIDAAESTDRLTLWIAMVNPAARFKEVENPIRRAVIALPAIRTAVAHGCLTVTIRPADHRTAVSTGTGKPRNRDLRERKFHL